MDALIFDFDGVIFDSEPVHISGFAQVVQPLGIEFTNEEYQQRYLGFDDYEVLRLMSRHYDMEISEDRINQLVAEKTAYLQKNLAEVTLPIPGVVELINSAAARGIPLGLCSGGLRDEIELGLKRLGVREMFPVVLAAEDVTNCKPHPEGYLRAAELLAEHTGQVVRPGRCVAIEDSPTGLAAVRAAGMKALAITSTYQVKDLGMSDKIVGDLTGVTVEMLEQLTEH